MCLVLVVVSSFFLNFFKEPEGGGGGEAGGVFCGFWETMLGRHVKPGNGRKRKRAVWPPLPHLLGDTGNQETGREGGEGGGWDTEGECGGKGGHYRGRHGV